MLLLSLDTCDARGSVALLDDSRILSEIPHPAAEEYSSWLLPAVDQALAKNGISHTDLGGYAVASGPGSFTGVRVGLTATKAWSEVYRKPIFPISRLAILADRADKNAEYAVTFIDAQRKQIFAALYRSESRTWKLIGDECVTDPAEFFEYALETSHGSLISWVSLDPELLTDSSFWQSRNLPKSGVIRVNSPLASSIGRYALRYSKETDALSLDANYVRRSDAEIFGKKASGT